jgi:hypothetical protein
MLLPLRLRCPACLVSVSVSTALHTAAGSQHQCSSQSAAHAPPSTWRFAPPAVAATTSYASPYASRRHTMGRVFQLTSPSGVTRHTDIVHCGTHGEGGQVHVCCAVYIEQRVGQSHPILHIGLVFVLVLVPRSTPHHTRHDGTVVESCREHSPVSTSVHTARTIRVLLRTRTRTCRRTTTATSSLRVR